MGIEIRKWKNEKMNDCVINFLFPFLFIDTVNVDFLPFSYATMLMSVCDIVLTHRI